MSLARACPICAAGRGRRIWSEGRYAYVRCADCGGVFSNIAEAEYDRERHNVWNDVGPDQDTVQFYGPARERAHCQFLDRHPVSGNRRLLDVGCGLGFFLVRARERGWVVHGLDNSPAWVSLANERLGAPLVELAALEESRYREGSFALITVWDVLEHIFDPVPFLARLARMLAPGGRLFVRTPNFAYVYPVYAARRWVLRQDVGLGPTNHVVYFTAATMRRALALAGLRACAWPVHSPPQVAPQGRVGLRPQVGPYVVHAKNIYARCADELARRTGGRVAIGSDLDVVCAAAADPGGP